MISDLGFRSKKACVLASASLLALVMGCDPGTSGDAPSDVLAQAETPTEPGEGSEPTAPTAPETCTPPASTSKDPCTAPLRPGDDRLCQYTFGGSPRKFYMYAPPSYDPCKPAALVVDAHGASESIDVHIGKTAFQANRPKGYGSGWRRAIQGDNAIVVTPQGIDNFWNQTRDVPWLNDVVDRMTKVARIDPERLYITGISMGGMISFATGCANTDRWRGIAGVAPLNPSCPRIKRPLPIIDFHAVGDQLTRYEGSKSAMEAAAKSNGCKRGPTKFASFGGPNSSPEPFCFKNPPRNGGPDAADPYAVPLAPCPTSAKESTCVKWDQCNEGVELVFCTVNAATQQLGGHLLYTNDTGLNVAVMSWDFFKKFWKK